MLQFFRRYQKLLFYVVGFAIIFSFAFFGTFSAFMQEKKEKGPKTKIAEAFDGSAVMSDELNPLSYLLNFGSETIASLQGNGVPFLINDGVILKDFVQTGYLVDLLQHDPQEFEKEIAEKIHLIKGYRPYVHPQLPFVSEEAVWKNFHPEMYSAYKQLQALPETSTLEGFSLLVKLYESQAQLPAYAVQRLLSMQQSQYGEGAKDPNLGSRGFALFGFVSAENWFGKKLINAIAMTIINGSKLAKKEGLNLSSKELRLQLESNVYHGLQPYFDKSTPSATDIKTSYVSQMHQLGLSETELLNIWKHVALFRKWMGVDSENMLVDALAQSAFEEYAEGSYEINLYSLPKELEFKSFSEVAEFEAYLDGVQIRKEKLGSLFGPYYSLAEVEKRCPSLIYKEYELEISEVSFKDLSRKIPLKQIISWQTENWEVLSEAFPYLVPQEIDSDDRFVHLETLDGAAREKLSFFAKKAILEKHENWVDEALLIAAPKEEVLKITLSAKTYPFVGAQSGEEVISFLDSICATGGVCEKKSFDGEHFYRVSVKKMPTDKAVLSFASAKKMKVLEALVSDKLNAHYGDIRKKERLRFQRADGSWKPLEEASYDLLHYEYKDLIGKLIPKAGELSHFAHLKVEEFPIDLLAKYRLLSHVQEVRDLLASGNLKEKDLSDLEVQWLLQPRRETLKRASDLGSRYEKIFTDQSIRVSLPEAAGNGGFAFVEVLEKNQNPSHVSSSQLQRKMVCREIEAKKFQKLLKLLPKAGNVQ